MQRLFAHRFVRFLAAGGVNTFVNFLVLNMAIVLFHQQKILASILATSSAIGCSFLLNRGFVFRVKGRGLIRLARFTIVSVAGVLLIQTSVYTLTLLTLSRFTWGTGLLSANLSNVVASFVVLFWNYFGYRHLVFQTRNTIQEYDKANEKVTTETA